MTNKTKPENLHRFIDQWATIAKMIERFGASKSYYKKLIREGHITSSKDPDKSRGLIFIHVPSFYQYLESNSNDLFNQNI